MHTHTHNSHTHTPHTNLSLTHFQVWSSWLLTPGASRETPRMVAHKSSPTQPWPAHRLMFMRRSAKLCHYCHRLWSSL
ncbi:unnamed protein product [Ectocarpus sp. 4 AP-2014]|uniref:EsV-1-219 n=1 Tax=Ectocarpus siliculosus virus 1 (isolate New Zealand/Kaikoura/1988) TaxID=654926 RepID=Q8QN71_ESV1K|nr:EsV-1-219 [Ectocarpus siliculosus virus 1]AAK14633.1 EsV-1-219 [Ectocarpus siliculosus virus 1]